MKMETFNFPIILIHYARVSILHCPTRETTGGLYYPKLKEYRPTGINNQIVTVTLCPCQTFQTD